MMFIEISPGRGLLRAAIFALVGTMILCGGLHLPPNTKTAAIFSMVAIGAVIDLLAARMAWTAVRWLVAGQRIYFRGPPK